MNKLNKPQATINRFEAALCLELVYQCFLKDNELKDTDRPDWYSILAENARTPLSPSALAKCCPRGNRGAYSQLTVFRIAGKPYYLRQDLHEWFRDHFEYRILNRAEAA